MSNNMQYQVSTDQIEVTDEFERAFQAMEYTNDNLFITGKAGTGKSTLLQYFRENTNKRVAVVAPTGAAAINVYGETIHSFFKLPARPIDKSVIKKAYDNRMYRALDTIIVDEVSMLRADVLDGMDYFLRLNRGKSRKAFGGLQMIFIGDLFQLPPVVAGDVQKRFMDSNYESPWFFSAAIFKQTPLRMFELQRIFRQTDNTFASILNSVRDASLSFDQMRVLNQTCCQPRPNSEGPAIALTTTNNRANTINLNELSKLSSSNVSYKGEVKGEVLDRALPADQQLVLKEGAQVLFVKNDPDNKWVNGTLGVIHQLEDELVRVKIDDRIVDVELVSWDMIKYEYDDATESVAGEVVGSYTQFPLKLAWAMTIHKSQGKTFERVNVDLGRGTFAHGQAYVALSRCTTMQGMRMQRPLRKRDIIVDQFILQFSQRHEVF